MNIFMWIAMYFAGLGISIPFALMKMKEQITEGRIEERYGYCEYTDYRIKVGITFLFRIFLWPAHWYFLIGMYCINFVWNSIHQILYLIGSGLERYFSPEEIKDVND